MSGVILIMAGGTGGHVFPGLAVADYLKMQGWKVVWLGTKNGMEADLVPQHGIDMEWIRFYGVRGKGLLRWVMLPFHMLLACWQSAMIIFRRRPDVVLGMGGFASFPGGLTAALLNCPLIIHEQNAVAGMTNKILARVADKVLVAFPHAFQSVSKIKTIWTGNPIRQEISSVREPEVRFAERTGSLNLFVVGGSLGAQVLNETVPKALQSLPAEHRPRVIHQAGKKHYADLNQAYTAAGVDAELLPFINNMAERYADCDLVICRAGALTVSELAAVGAASILIPFPNAVDDHQTQNAKFLSDTGAAQLIPQSKFSAAGLAQLLSDMTRDKLLQMARAARKLGQPDATMKVAHACMEYAK